MYPNPNMMNPGGMNQGMNPQQGQSFGQNQGFGGFFPQNERFNQLERRVSRLERQMQRLEARVRRLESGFPVPLSSGREYEEDNNHYML